MNIGIIGCGLIGHKRAKALGKGKLVAVADVDISKAKKLAELYSNVESYTNYQDLLDNSEIDIVIIATLHDSLAEITYQAVKAKKHVLVEKPAARNFKELEKIIPEAKKNNVFVRIGFNHRYHKAMLKACELLKDEDKLGKIMFIRARYGHGGRVGYDKEWRANPELSGGGELIDQGVHLIDLSRKFLGDIVKVQSVAQTCYWDMPVDDNAFMILQNASNNTAFLQVSCSEWKNMFSFEIYCEKAKLEIAGLGGSYGVEQLKYYQMTKEMGPPNTIIYEYPQPDDSWATELALFYEDIKHNRNPEVSIEDAYEVLKVVNTVYKQSDFHFAI